VQRVTSTGGVGARRPRAHAQGHARWRKDDSARAISMQRVFTLLGSRSFGARGVGFGWRRSAARLPSSGRTPAGSRREISYMCFMEIFVNRARARG
jgi:hypothetical protein